MQPDEIEAIIFDFDGTLVDIYSREDLVYKEIAEEIIRFTGINVELSRLISFIKERIRGLIQKRILTRELWWADLFETFGISTTESVIRRLSIRYWARLLSISRIYNDVPITLPKLQRVFKLAIMADSDGKKGIKRWRIELSGISRFFDEIIIAGEDTDELKPSREPFIYVLEKLKVEPQNAIYIGDRNNIDSGCKKAGMWFGLIIREHNINAPKFNADFIIASLRELLDMLV